ncbi:methyl-CpG-binding domain protein 3-like 2B [Mirounga angustirostris]|uniref:methyl-CpG-binding domain protein 3-like 2B n=1 Tax=Mirounga angustirostris TaxID=9716 RepID=UPI00313EA4C5
MCVVDIDKEHSLWLVVLIPHFIQISHFILFSKGKLKRNMMSQTIEKKRQVHLAKAKKRYHERAAPPIRLTSCIFKRPVTSITSHSGNEVRYSQRDRALEKPQQISVYRRLQGLQACSSEGEILSTLDFINTSQVIVPGSAGAGSLPSGPGPSTVPSSVWAGMFPGVGLYLPPPICIQPVTPGDIRRQTRKVKKARERLAEALRADRLAREVERARSQEGHSEHSDN